MELTDKQISTLRRKRKEEKKLQEWYLEKYTWKELLEKLEKTLNSSGLYWWVYKEYLKLKQKSL
jgi:hypothetical protein